MSPDEGCRERKTLDPKVLDINKLVSGMSQLLRRTIGEPVEIETVLAGGLWRTFADPFTTASPGETAPLAFFR